MTEFTVFTVADLIEYLKEIPPETPVRSMGGELSVFVSDEYYDGDSANPNCPVIKAVVFY